MDVEEAEDAEEEEEEEEGQVERKDRDRPTHSELIKLGAAGAGKGGKIGVWGVYAPGRPIMTDPDSRCRIPARLLNAELTCPICLSIVRSTHTFMECLHRFCQECIEKYLRLGQKECPKCRVKVSSRRALRPDPAFDKIIQKFYPDIVSLLVLHARKRKRKKRIHGCACTPLVIAWVRLRRERGREVGTGGEGGGCKIRYLVESGV